MSTPKKKTGRTTAAKPKPAEPTGPTDVKSWKRKSGGPVELKVPSGNVCLANAPGLPAFFTAGLIPNSLMPIMTEAMDGKEVTEKRLQEQMMKTLGDRSKTKEMFDMVDHVVMFCVVEPEIQSAPEKGEERDEDLLYIDQVDDEDKWFIWNWAVGGTSDLERFRKEQRKLVVAVSSGTDVGSKAKRTPRAAKR
jgi:hypothetical protein